MVISSIQHWFSGQEDQRAIMYDEQYFNQSLRSFLGVQTAQTPRGGGMSAE
jgi:hypothetical protein